MVVGACLGGVYDLVRLSRAMVGICYSRRFAHRLVHLSLPLVGCVTPPDRPKRKRRELFLNLYVALGDILFFLIASVTFTVFLYHANNGILRWYFVAGMVGGFVFYYMTLGKLVLIASELIVFILRAAVAYLGYFLLRPVCKLLRLLRLAVYRLARSIGQRYRVYAMRKYTKNIENTLDKFPEIV